jgi:hypothetical protein
VQFGALIAVKRGISFLIASMASKEKRRAFVPDRQLLLFCRATKD